MSNEVKHTAEPWHVGMNGSSIYDQYGWGVATITDIPTRRTAEEDKANARRIVACLNACAGIPTECLEFGPDAVAPASVLQQRDQLLAALEHVMRCIPLGGFAQIHHNSDTWRQIDEAITAAKGGAA